ncbi:Rrf2 family transcriptional regulator [Flavobacterium sp. ENC]|uniref:Rrf2 family transcriptional regulator n=1 Tax=Flavobacterium sp. ENC TaxID=2897330 RepID=UPI001E5A83B9|nr:Rrf2 family transcriptional regulator [Flavobacterium sp. ENC]MCD0467013.1 Rrf2 family transcriptional regulator [Flavobacterium sp. ENC]
MKADAKYTTAIHICLYLHFRGEALLSSKELGESVNTNPVVIRRIATELRSAGILASVAGKQGGFHLTKKVEQISLWEIYLAVSDRELFNKPKVNPECPVSRNLSQLVNAPFSAAELAMRPVLEKQTIADLYTKLQHVLDSENQLVSVACK